MDSFLHCSSPLMYICMYACVLHRCLQWQAPCDWLHCLPLHLLNMGGEGPAYCGPFCWGAVQRWGCCTWVSSGTCVVICWHSLGRGHGKQLMQKCAEVSKNWMVLFCFAASSFTSVQCLTRLQWQTTALVWTGKCQQPTLKQQCFMIVLGAVAFESGRTSSYQRMQCRCLHQALLVLRGEWSSERQPRRMSLQLSQW